MARANRKSQIAPADRSDAVMNAGTGADPHNDTNEGNPANRNPGNGRAMLHASQVDDRRKGEVATDHAVPFMRPNTVWDDARNENPYISRRTKLGLPAATRGSTDVKENAQAGANARRK